jgi:hypothetical protein
LYIVLNKIVNENKAIGIHSLCPLPRHTTTIMEAHDDSLLMAARTAPRVSRDVTRKKTAGKSRVSRPSTLDAAAEYTLKDFLADEPDLYSVSDIKVRYR